jgi:hypothetical protein
MIWHNGESGRQRSGPTFPSINSIPRLKRRSERAVSVVFAPFVMEIDHKGRE